VRGADARGVQLPAQVGRVGVVAEHGHEVGARAERGEVGGRVAGSAGCRAGLGELDHRHRPVAAEPARGTGEPAVEQRVADDDDTRRPFGDPAGERGGDGHRGGQVDQVGTGWWHRSSSGMSVAPGATRRSAAAATSPGGTSRHS
jgi:hypothetical protein